ncbi:MAG TPA: type I polyketide synthase, partial [Vicinamibacterales bacterium]
MTDLSEKIARLSPKRLALLALELQEKLDAIEGERREPIAIVGVGCRFPGGADDPEAFWRLLRDGVDAVTEVPAERWDVDAYYDPDPEAPARTYSRHGAFLRNVDRFDPQFFGIAPREALRMDPQQRLVLEVSWEALEHAAIAPTSLAGSATGVFVGISGHDYSDLLGRGGSKYLDAHFLTGNPLNFAAGRLSYTLGLQGPSLAVDTACSSSLVAVHLACQSLRAKECRVALAAGVNLVLVPEANVVLAKARMLAVDGRCKTFDAAADGYVRGEGCGVLVLKRLSDAVSNGDRILAVIRGSATNQDGPSSGLTVPNGLAQRALIREALGMAGLKPVDVSYLEAHGTGTSLGDPIEVQALAAALGEGRSPADPLLIGSVKTNVGHLEAAAGIAGLIKVILSLQHRTIPPHLHLKKINPHISLDAVPAVIPVTATDWTPSSGRRVAGVSSFGASGTNAHVVLEEAPEPVAAVNPVARPVHVLAISARTSDALQDIAGNYAAALRADDRLELADVCFTANTGRAHFSHRLAVVVEDRDQLTRALERVARGDQGDDVIRGQAAGPDRPKVAFVFPAAGATASQAPQELYDTQPTFRRAFDRCAEALGLPSRPADAKHGDGLVFATEYALAELWRAWGVEAAAALGFGVGEYVAACVAGVITLEQAVLLVAARLQSQDALDLQIASVAYRQPSIALISGISGAQLGSEACDPAYWRRQARSSFAVPEALETLVGNRISRAIEFGAEGLDAQLPSGARGVTWVRSRADDGSDWRELLAAAARLYAGGVAIDWSAFDGDYRRRKLPLPTYPFRRQRFWPDIAPLAGAPAEAAGHALLGSRLRTALAERLYECRLTPDRPSFLADHQVLDSIVVPATGYVAMALDAAHDAWPDSRPAVLDDLIIHQPLIVPAGGRTVQTAVALGES